MSSQNYIVNNKTLVSNIDNKSSSSKVPLKEPTLKLNMEEFREMTRLKTAGDEIGIEDLKKKVRQRMELELTSDITRIATASTNNKKTATSKQAKATTATTSSPSGNVSVKFDKSTAVNHKKIENVSTYKNGNMVSNEDKKVAVKKAKPVTTTTSKSTSEILTINKEKQKEKSKSSGSTSNINHGSNKGKSTVIRQENSTSSTSTSKGINGILFNNKGRQSTINKEVTGIKVSSSSSGLIANKPVSKFEKCVERWKSCREFGGKYRPLELFLPREILNDKSKMITVEKIAKEFELERLRKLLEHDKEKPNGNKKLAQRRIDNLNNFGKNYTRLEIAAVRNEEGPKEEQKIRAHIAFLNEKNIIKKKITMLDVIEDPYYLKKGLEQFQKYLQQKETEKDVGRRGKLKGTLEFKRQEEERKRKRQQTSEIERKSEKLGGKLAEQKRHQESVAEIKRRQERERARRVSKAGVQHRHNRLEDLRSRNSNAPKNETSKPTSLKKRTLDERSEVSSSSRAPKRRNVGSSELDICSLDETTVNENLSSIIHQIFRPGRKPMYGMIDDHDDDAMEVSGYEVLREEARSSRIARKEDEDEERAEQQRRIRKLNKKKARGAGI
ncbi:hypothetical protein RclHR1_12970005 [Rhizophagus clarus]|uniref:Uncharacterized protein n=1 Tax=Rhizophagus clarus TaxID=94130 RepID=A0A2Z6QDE8_9GLOM|nr:hypothetical protein RclHR1_12970005 [Rhizophagus clarus]GET01941.1 hypothetical protein GLOIN_2v1708007 [Rhizophagus clarus]